METDSHPELTGIAQAARDIEVYGVIVLDLSGFICSWNAGATLLLQYSEEEIRGRHFEVIFSSEDRQLQAHTSEMEKALSQNDAYDDRWHRRKDGSLVYVNGGLGLIKGREQESIGFMKILRDQTEKRLRTEQTQRLNAQLWEAQKKLQEHAGQLEERVAERTRLLDERNAELEAFCYSIAHDLRAPLRSIQAMAQVVLEDYGAAMDLTCRDYLGRISRAGLRLDSLTLDLLKYSRLSREEIRLETTSTEGVLEEVLASMSGSVAEKEASIEVTHPLPLVHAQHAYLMQIFFNLISNSLKFVSPGRAPRIQIRAKTSEGRVILYFQDNGIGIPEEYRHRVFQLFERLHPEGTFEGTGAGLAIALKAASRIGGSITLKNTSEEGTTFQLDLEAARTPAAPGENPS